MTELKVSQRYDTLDGMRGIAALAVMIYHFTSFDGAPLFFNVNLAVDLFFMLSGFVLIHAYGARLRNGMDYFQYVWRRVIRLQPMLLIGLLIGTPVLYLLSQHGASDTSSPMIAGSFLFNSFFLPSFNEAAVHNMGEAAATIGAIFPANPPAWSLCYEMMISLLLPFFLLLTPKQLMKLVLLAFVALVARGFVESYLHGRIAFDFGGGWSSLNFLGGFFRVLYGFTVGVMIHGFITRKEHLGKIRFPHSALMLYLGVMVMLAFPMTVRGLYTIFALVVLAPGLLFVGASMPNLSGNSQKIAQFLGWLSYPIYCLHYPIGRAVFLWAEQAGYARDMAAIGAVALTLLASVALTKLLEEPVRRYMSNRLLNRT